MELSGPIMAMLSSLLVMTLSVYFLSSLSRKLTMMIKKVRTNMATIQIIRVMDLSHEAMCASSSRSTGSPKKTNTESLFR